MAALHQSGRHAEAPEAFRLLRRGMDTVPIVVVCGAPETGKTAFAVHVAHRLRTAFPDGQWFVRLSTSDGHPRTLADVLAVMLITAGIEQADIPEGLGARAARLRALLVLDDARVLTLEPLSQDEAVGLLSRLIGPATPHGMLTEISRLCDDLSGPTPDRDQHDGPLPHRAGALPRRAALAGSALPAHGAR
ncbi:hypothetical protein HD597_000561 [Nonomuraea thailandensis]|uniref:NB-ARC domain-containing protein n=1 Tax=Nonomuraea thailandensis TaxID=1188745 RepID=A0A9X2G768_9ACTN|nr:hypothetical protein [Nonomuraea thailandensis]MCP2353541.1 hypothetical protein [Nonomuraea thailandensis]